MLRALRTAAPKFMLASLVIAAVSAGIIGRAQGQSADIPLQLVSFGTGSSQTYSLGINIGIGSGAPKPYLFDTGSAPFNAGYSPQWWPSSITPTNPPPLAIGISYSYATGTTLTGNVVTVPSISFYASSVATMPSYTLPTLTPGYQVAAITSSTIPDFSNLIQNNQPFIRGSFYGVFGAGDFVNVIGTSGGTFTLGGVLGQSAIPGTAAGYVVAANGQQISTVNGPQGTQTVTSCSPCVILGLTPSLLAQFTTIVPWSGNNSVSFPNSGAPSSTQFGNTFNLSLSAARQPTVSWSGPTLLDTGTASMILHGPSGVSIYQSNQLCGDPAAACANNGTTVSVAGAVPGGAVSTQTTLDPATNGSTYTVTLKTPLGNQVVGIPFFLQNSVLFDLNGQAVGYTSNFVTDTPIVTPLNVSSSSVPLGLAGVISGTGGVSITAGGSATLTAMNTYTGPTVVSGGGQLFLAGPGSIASSALTVDGLVAGTGTLGPTTVNAGGMLAPGNGSTGTFLVAGNLLLNPGSAYLTSVMGSTASSTNVSGSATLAGTEVTVFQPGNVIRNYTLLSAAGGRSGTFDMLATIGLPFSLNASLGYTANNVILNLTSQVATVPGLTPNEMAVGGSFDNVFNSNGGLPAFDTLYALSPAGLALALNQLSGQSLASEQTVLSNQALYSREAVLARLRQAGYAKSAGPQAVLAYAGPDTVSLDDAADPGPPLAYTGNKTSGVASPFPLKAPPAALPYAPTTGITFWAQGMGGWGKINGNSNAAGTTGNFAGVLSGADIRFSNNWLVGFALGYTGSSTNVSALASSAQVDTGLVAGYAGTSFGAWNLRLGGTYGINSVYTSRQIAFPGFMDHDTARFNAGTSQVFGEVGYGTAISSVAVEPFAGLAYVHLDTAGFTESGGISALSTSGASQDTGYSSLGVRAAAAYTLWNGIVLIPRASVAWQYAFGEINPATSLAFAGIPGSNFNVTGVPIARTAALIDAGADLRINPQAKVGLYYWGQQANTAHENGVRGTLTWMF